ncbi:ATP-dependent metallopeptidase FtsH/Yme1/Tma family protein [Paraflavitalea soli]|uniref:ATP-dependent zinc metalloprotease FtsH n=1 Tax=Paraflavitalea soli TaxID=2315862 RepID=A0A3B7MUN9_9BACT|nr:ATP-dependent zinc metalloprotease FtsH [Paraflavitalea soli]AXY74181.1 ATP-dependent metallopeptidase FtsH/Yme1/Tma family protein [Paraflavitalea soli]
MPLDKQPEQPAQQPGQPNRFRFFWWIFTLTGILLLPLLVNTVFRNPAEISWSDFEQRLLSRNVVDRITVVNGDYAEIYIKRSFGQDPLFKEAFKPLIGKEPYEGPHYKLNIGSVESFDRKLEAAQQKYHTAGVAVSYEKRSGWFWGLLGWTIPLLVMFFWWQYMVRRSGGGSSAFNFGKSTATLLDKANKSTVTFEQVAGLEEAKMEVREIVDFLKSPQAFTRLGAKIPKGVILVGPPGTGKTLLARAVAGEAQVPFFTISGSEFVEMFVGVGASRVRDLFKRAKEKAPCIVFIDEIDAIGRSRGRNALFTGASDERESTLNQLLTEMDGFGTNTGVIVLAATNRADMLDPALLRPGRFDRHIYLELPNLTEREAIFKVHQRPLVMDDSIDTKVLAGQTPGFSGADIANICNEAALIAARHKEEKISRQDFFDAIDRIVAGLEKKSKIISPEEKRVIAFHEAGHAVASWLLTHIDPLVKVSIIPRGKSLGAAWYLPEEKQLRTRTSFYEHLSATLAGRAAEEIIFGEISSGALDDLEKATKEAYMMVACYGFSKKIGHISFYDSTGQHDSSIQKPYSEETGRLIDEEVRNLISEAYTQANNLLVQHKPVLIRLADKLLEKEVLLKEDLEKILGERARNTEYDQTALEAVYTT